METDLTDFEASHLRGMEKHRKSEDMYKYPDLCGGISIPLVSANKKEEFSLAISRGHIDISRNSFVNVARKAIPLVRLDLAGGMHHNPDGTEIPLPHIHIYKEGFALKWAYPLPKDFANCNSVPEYLDKFMDFCNITKKPKIDMGLFV